MFSLLSAPTGVAYHVVYALAQALGPLTGGPATIAAIVVFTVAVRLLLLPLSYYALRGQAGMAAVLPQAQELRKRYAHQPERLQRELTALYQREGTGLLGGCLPLLIQLPFLSVLYALFRSGTIGGRPNALLHRELLGAPLGSHWLSGAGPLSAHGLVFLGLFALLAVVAVISALWARRHPGPLGAAKPPAGQAAPASQSRAPARSRAGASQSRAAAGRRRTASPTGSAASEAGTAPAGVGGVITWLLPFFTLVVAAFLPLAAGIYLLVTTAWTVTERAVLQLRIARSPRPQPSRPGTAVA
jgi:YidC/Oxa1 family membrane protein insertase